MRKTDRFTRFTAAILFLAFAAYIGVYIYRAITDNTVTAEAMATTVSISGVATGLIVREETVLESSEKYIDLAVRSGTKVGAGQTVARAMSSETGLERASRMHELELEIERVSAALSGQSGGSDLSKRDEALKSAIISLTTDVARHDFIDMESDALGLRTLLFGDGENAASESHLRQLEAELFSLQNSSSSDTTDLVCEVPGVFSGVVDGYEHVTSADIKSLTPAILQELIDSGETPGAGAYGKIVTDFNWYFAAVMDESHMANLSLGAAVSLNFGRYFSEDVAATVYYVGTVSDGSVSVVFKCSEALSDTLNIRECSAIVTFEEYSGIRIPSEAIQFDDENPNNVRTYVWVVTAMKLERKSISILYAGDGFVLVERAAAANALREGNTVVVSGTDLYAGKMMK